MSSNEPDGADALPPQVSIADILAQVRAEVAGAAEGNDDSEGMQTVLETFDDIAAIATDGDLQNDVPRIFTKVGNIFGRLMGVPKPRNESDSDSSGLEDNLDGIVGEEGFQVSEG